MRPLFVSYLNSAPSGFGFGNAVITGWDKCISTIDDIRELARRIEETQHVEKVVILNFTRTEIEDGDSNG